MNAVVEVTKHKNGTKKAIEADKIAQLHVQLCTDIARFGISGKSIPSVIISNNDTIKNLRLNTKGYDPVALKFAPRP